MKIFAFILFSLSLAFAKKQKKCRALVLQGGGDRGAYQAGAIKAFVNALPAEQRNWQVVSGISIGAMNAFGVGQFPPDQDEDMADLLYYFWEKIAPQKLF